MMLQWLKKQTEKKFFSNKDNNFLIKELKALGIKDDNFLSAMKKVPRELFIDEIYNISWSSKIGGGGPDVSREGVQRDLLPIVEGTSVTTKYGIIKTDHILFIAAGAFHLSKPSDLIPELQGRFPIRVELDTLTQDDFLKILCEPKNSLTKQYKALIKSENVEIVFNEDALKEISKKAFIINSEIENIGARRLHTVMSKLLNEILFDIPEKIGPNAKIVITKENVEDKLNSKTENKDLSEYILWIKLFRKFYNFNITLRIFNVFPFIDHKINYNNTSCR